MPPADEVAGGGDGLDELDKRRQRRRPLPPRNPRVPPPAALAPAVADEPSERARESPEPEASIDVESSGSEPTDLIVETRSAPTDRRAGAVEPGQEAEALRLAQFYVTSDIDRYLRAVRAEALTQDVDVTASAVARMALQRLADEMTPLELVRHLGGPRRRRGRGRPRR